MIIALLLAAAVTAAPAPTKPPPTPEEIYTAGRTPFAGLIRVEDLKQEFVEQADGTYLGVVKPTFEQERKLKALATKQQYSNLVGPWDAVSRQIGSVRDKDGTLVSIEKAFGIKDDQKPTYLVVTAIDSRAKPGEHRCVSVLTGVSEGQPFAAKEPELVPRGRLALTGCGLIKTLLLVVDEEKALREAKTLEDAVQAANQLNNAVFEALGLQTVTKVIDLEEPTKTGEEQK
jgi:hypothetical protein